MTITQEGIDINKHFFNALDILKASGKIRGIQTFTRKHNINRWNLITVRDNPSNSFLKPEWIAFICKDYNISLEWIFFGTGNFYNV